MKRTPLQNVLSRPTHGVIGMARIDGVAYDCHRAVSENVDDTVPFLP